MGHQQIVRELLTCRRSKWGRVWCIFEAVTSRRLRKRHWPVAAEARLRPEVNTFFPFVRHPLMGVRRLALSGPDGKRMASSRLILQHASSIA